jgi:NAD(P)-dependent dehydrogenase (short-subunit alcohol dehydrogenase family)
MSAMQQEPREKVSASVALVTGATGAIGKAIATRIAARPGYEVVLLCRNAEKAQAAVAQIRQQTGNDRVRPEIVDLERRDSVFSLADRWEGPVHILVNNAATTPRRREETPEGIERQFATNVLG